MLPAMLPYLRTLVRLRKSNGGKVAGRRCGWTVNLIYLALAIVLNLWDTVPVAACASFRVKAV